ncbi:MAG: DUF4956 domain-containing protein [Cyclobacteriaceae bacterium]|nr:DUF4956 domain-containing protein [Cyclobacteriaceae bacterium]
MFDSLIDHSYYEFPSFKVAVFSLLLAFVLSTVIAFTYKYTFRGISYSGNFFQAMILSSPATAMVIMSVGNNVAVGFGIIGAIAIIRFRTRVNEPRNIIFIFASIGVGIAAGVYGYSIAIAGTLIFCSVAFMLYFSPHGKSYLYLYTLTFNLAQKDTITEVVGFMEKNCDSYFFMSLGQGKAESERYEYRISLKNDSGQKDLTRNLMQIAGVSNVKLIRRDNSERL